MSTISVPLPAELEKFVNDQVKERGSNKAEVVRVALRRMAEEEAVQSVLRAEQEPTLKGNLDELARKLSG